MSGTRSSLIVAPNGRPARFEVRNYYEAARSSILRSTIPGAIQSAKKDIARAPRRELLRLTRYLYNNSPLIRGILQRLVMYVIGTGLYPVPASSDPEWNKRADRRWSLWARFADLTSRAPFSVLQWEICLGAFLGGTPSRV